MSCPIEVQTAKTVFKDITKNYFFLDFFELKLDFESFLRADELAAWFEVPLCCDALPRDVTLAFDSLFSVVDPSALGEVPPWPDDRSRETMLLLDSL